MSGRPSVFSKKLAQQIYEKLWDGLSLVKICEINGMPNRSTVIRWMQKNPDFASECARAREEQGELMDQRMLDVADKVEKGELDPHAGKVVLSALQWRAAKLKPKVYGDRIENRMAGPDGEALKIEVTGVKPTEFNT